MEVPSGIAFPGPDRNHLWTWIHMCANSVAKPLVTGLTSGNLAAAAAAKSLQSCLTLCNPIDCSPPGSSVPGILQARMLEWFAIAFSSNLAELPLNTIWVFSATTPNSKNLRGCEQRIRMSSCSFIIIVQCEPTPCGQPLGVLITVNKHSAKPQA